MSTNYQQKCEEYLKQIKPTSSTSTDRLSFLRKMSTTKTSPNLKKGGGQKCPQKGHVQSKAANSTSTRPNLTAPRTLIDENQVKSTWDNLLAKPKGSLQVFLSRKIDY